MYVPHITDDYNIITFTICTNNENFIGIIIPALLLTISCGLSFLCLLSWMVYTLIKPLIKNQRWRTFYTQIIQFDVS